MSARLEIDALRALIAISDLGGVTRAAKHLGLSQSAVSHKIRRMELTLDSSILTRRAGAPLLTEAGERLIAYARRMTDLHDEALAVLGRKPISGVMRLGVTEDTATSDISRIIGRFTRQYPKVTVRVRTGQSLNVQDWLNAGELDVGIVQVFQHDALAGDLALFNDSLHWVKSPDLLLEQAGQVPFISFDQDCFYRRWGFCQDLPSGRRLETVMECPSAAGIQAAVRSGLGVALLNGIHITPDIEVLETGFPRPPALVFVARTGPEGRNAPVSALLAEIERELLRLGTRETTL